MEISAVTLSLSSLILLVSTANFLHLKDWYDRPKPAISFIEDECVHACDKEPKHTDYRLKIENKGRSIFYNANVKVVKMSRYGVILKINP